MTKRANKKGFTLIELIIVVAIMAVLVALLAPSVMKYLEKSKISKDLYTLDSIRTAIETELMDCEEIFHISTGKETIDGVEKVKGIYLKDIADGRGNDGFDKLAERLFGDSGSTKDNSLHEAFLQDNVLSSKAARVSHAKIAVYIDGNSNVAVAAIKGESGGGIVEFDGDNVMVSTRFDIDSIDTNVANLGGGSTPAQPS